MCNRQNRAAHKLLANGLLNEVISFQINSSCSLVQNQHTGLAHNDGLVLTAESREEVTDMFNRWKEEMEQSGLKVNMEKTKLIMT
ncbi:hypothetical protein E2C01_002794 [Portunus trituberculatus]|uniref:Reverse transcriptase domain-containing protein n=1 Tax=Portunus trituberculatus TaxID=210409 RepID=A0A5B7CP56_PORTR|nr:hypothetical protein [Portunus trituberculatus]